MTDDDLWNLILGDNANGPSVTPFANNLGQSGAGVGSPPPNSGSLLDRWKSTGLGGDTLAMLLPQRDDNGGSLPPPWEVAPSAPLASLGPSSATLDQLAMMYGMSPQQVAALRGGAERQVAAQNLAGDLLVPLVDAAVPDFGAFMLGKKLLTGGMDMLNSLNAAQEPQRAANAGDQAIFKSLNDSGNQSANSQNAQNVAPWRAFPW